MTGARILPFPAVGGVNAPPRPVPPFAGGAGFAGVMDDALGASSPTRRDNAVGSTSTPRPRRLEAVKPRATQTHAAPAPRRTASAVRKPVADPVDDTARDEKPARTGDRRGEAAPVEAAASRAEEAPAKAEPTAGDAAEQCTAADVATSESAPDAVQATVVAVAAPTELSAAEGDVAGNAGPSAVMLPGVPATGEEVGEAKEADAGVRARTPAASTGLPGQDGAKRTASARAETADIAGEPLVELAPEFVEGAHEDAVAPPAAQRLATPVTDNEAPSGAKASATDAAAAFAEAVAEVEAVAETGSSGGAGVADAGTHDQQAPRQAPSTGGQAAHAVAAAAGTNDGVRFTVNVAAGSAAYASAAPRHEEAVLPQIVQSIRLQTTQGMSEARVQLKPEHLGTLNITLKVEQGQVTATIQAGVAAVRQWIESNESSLRQALSEQGLQLTRLVVQPDEEQAGQDSLEQRDTRRQRQRRSWRDEDVTFEVLV